MRSVNVAIGKNKICKCVNRVISREIAFEIACVFTHAVPYLTRNDNKCLLFLECCTECRMQHRTELSERNSIDEKRECCNWKNTFVNL